MKENNEDFDFESLPFDMQMKVKQSMRNMHNMAENIEEIGDRMSFYLQTLGKVAQLGDNPSEARKVLVLAAEKMEAQKTLPGSEGVQEERAREMDWLRHVIDEKPQLIEFAVDTLETCIRGDFDGAWRKFDAVFNIREDEFTRIVDYWKEALES